MRGPGWSSVILVTVLISTAVSMGVQWASDTGRLGALWQGQRLDAEPAASDVGPRAVPQLIGLPRKIAGELLKSRDLLLVVREEREDAEVPKGAVLQQDPLPGSELAAGGQVSVVLSKGSGPQVQVPSLVGLSLQAAQAQLEGAKLTLGEVQGPEGGSDRVVTDSDPAADEQAKQGEKVNLTVELGTVEVPRVTGLNVRKATEALEAVGLKVGKVRSRFDDLRPAWAVLAQKPEAGEQAAPGSEVMLVRNEE